MKYIKTLTAPDDTEVIVFVQYENNEFFLEARLYLEHEEEDQIVVMRLSPPLFRWLRGESGLLDKQQEQRMEKLLVRSGLTREEGQNNSEVREYLARNLCVYLLKDMDEQSLLDIYTELLVHETT